MVIYNRSGVYKEFRPGHWKALGGVGGGVGGRAHGALEGNWVLSGFETL